MTRHSKGLMVALGTVLLAGPVPAQPVEDAAAAARAYRQANEVAILQEYADLLRIPNYGSDDADIRRNAAKIREMMERRGVTTRLLESEGSPPAIYGELMVPGADTTIMIYVHYDGQATGSGQWTTPAFEPTLRAGRLEDNAAIADLATLTAPVDPDWRLYARSASDDKIPFAGITAALDALKSAGIRPAVNLKFFFEGEEELGSPHLRQMLADHRDTLAADFWLFFDGPRDQRGNPTVVLGVRGSFGVNLTVYGPVRGLHSGHYGNFAPNPIVRLSHLISTMRDEESRILIDGFYDDVMPPGESERALIAAVPEADAAIRENIGVGGSESPGLRYEETKLWPALNLRGFQAGQVGDLARNIIVPSATASIGFRLVPNQTPARIIELVEAHVASQGYHIVHEDPDMDTRLRHERIAKLDWSEAGYPAVRTSPDHPVVRSVVDILGQVSGDNVIVKPSSGGSLPLYHFTEILGADMAMIPIANEDNSQHAPNENIRIGNLWEGIEFYAAIFAGLRLD